MNCIRLALLLQHKLKWDFDGKAILLRDVGSQSSLCRPSPDLKDWFIPANPPSSFSLLPLSLLPLMLADTYLTLSYAMLQAPC